MLFSNRYRDFNSDIIEKSFSPFFQTGNNKVNMIITISLDGNTDTEFYVERFASRNRGGFGDNEGVNINSSAFTQINQNLDGDQFYETKLPFVSIIYNQTQKGHPYVVGYRQDYNHINSIFTTDVGPNDTPADVNDPTVLPSGTISISGSGGDYFSNEIFYHVSRLREKLDPNLPSGHIHIPLVPVTSMVTVIDKIKEIIKNALLVLILLLSFQNNGFSQVGADCFFRVFSEKGKVITSKDTSLKIDVFFLGNKGEFPIILDSKALKNSHSVYDSASNIFNSGISYGGNAFTIIIRRSSQPKDTMKIKVIMNAGFKNYQFDSIPFIKGSYEIDVAKVLNEKFNGNYKAVENEKMKWGNKAEKKKMLHPIPNLWDITPPRWIDVKK